MGEHGFAPVQPNRVAKIDGEYEIDHGSRREPERFDLEKHTHGRKISSPTAMKPSAWYRQVDGRRDLVSFQQTSFHLPVLFFGDLDECQDARAVKEIKSRSNYARNYHSGAKLRAGHD
jgi:hypothetical protein